METKNAKVRRLVASREYKQALQICKDWDYSDPTHRDILSRGYECLMYPEFYKQIGYDPNAEYDKAVSVLRAVYGEESSRG